EPTLEPTAEPTVAPTALPTAAPTFGQPLQPTVGTPLQINVVQVIIGVNATAFIGDPGSQPAFTQAVAIQLGYIAPSDVLLQGAVPVLRRLLRNLIATDRIEVSAEAVNAESNVTAVSYTILTTAEDVGFVDAAAAFADVSAQLVEAVESGDCARNLHDQATIWSVPLLLDVVCGTVTVELGRVSSFFDDDASGTIESSDGRDMSRLDLTTVVVSYTVVFVAICIVALCTYYMRTLLMFVKPETTVKLTAKAIVEELGVLNCEEKSDTSSVTAAQEQEAKSDVDWESNPMPSRGNPAIYI
ncbi:hypothetical protein B484DRAFT_56, partial [Ochromonadaceae sp. CCMP2298]